MGLCSDAWEGTDQEQYENDEKDRSEHGRHRCDARIAVTLNVPLGSLRGAGTIARAFRSINLLRLAETPQSSEDPP